MHYYKKKKLPVEVDLERKEKSSDICEVPAQDAETLLYYGEKMAKLKDVIYHRAKRNIDAAQSEYKQQYDLKHCDNRVGIIIEVCLISPGTREKIYNSVKTQPLRIIQRPIDCALGGR